MPVSGNFPQLDERLQKMLRFGDVVGFVGLFQQPVKPMQAKIAIYDGDEPVTNVETLSFESESSDMNEWRQEVWLTLASQTFDKRKPYHFIVRNAETGVEEARMDVTIDLAFDNDF